MPAGLRLLRQGFGGVLDAVVPQSCIGCGRWIRGASGRACDRCVKRLNRLSALPYCHRCGRTVHLLSRTTDGCPACQSERLWNFSGLVRVGPYEGVLRDAVLRVKYGGDVRTAHELAERLAAALRETSWFPAVRTLTPVPMHWLRRWQRPLNHAAVLTDLLAKLTGKRVARPIRRVRYALSQTALPVRAQRFDNVRGCFAPARSIPAAVRALLAAAPVCIVDNFVGSGATLHEVAKALRRAGAREIYAAVVARSVVAGDWQAESAALAPPERDELAQEDAALD